MNPETPGGHRSARTVSLPFSAVGVLLCVWLAILVAGCGKRQEEPHPPRPAMTVAQRLDERPAWLGVSDSLSPAEFEQDPHEFACARCHGPRYEKTDKEWKATCTESGCHFRAWPKTEFHRVTLAVFNKCDNCHQPHVWKLEGDDCTSCHAAMMAPGITVAVSQLPGVAEFPHGNHASLECSSCHDSETSHGALLIRNAAECRSCHHGPEQAAACSDCHTPSEVAGERRMPQNLKVASTSRARTLPFDHRRHAALECETCHASDETARPSTSCTNCHGAHHEPDSRCATCHEAPPPGAHSLAVHETGCATAGCHGQGGFPAMESNRNFCTSCHREMMIHFPDKNCETCHKLGPMGSP